jgi:hypothetical protein
MPACGLGRETRNSYPFGYPARIGDQFGQPEVQHFGLASTGEKNVSGLEISMDDTAFVRYFESVRDLDGDFQDLIVGERFTCDQVLQGLAGKALHHDEGVAVGFVNLVNRADVGVVESGSGAGFSLESLKGLIVPHQVGWEKLDSNIPAQAEIHGAVDHSHATAAEMFLNPVVGDDFANHKRPAREVLADCHVRPRGRSKSMEWDGVH